MTNIDYFTIGIILLIHIYFLINTIFQIIDSGKRNRDEFEKLIEENEKRMKGENNGT